MRSTRRHDEEEAGAAGTTDLEREARKRVKALKDFYIHLASYLIVNGILVIMNLLSSPDYFWAIWPILGWGIGLLSNAVQVFGMFGLGSKEWEERKVQEYILQRQSGLSAAQVKQLMRDELRSQQSALPSPAEWDRMRQRLEHLEAIVTTEDFDRLHNPPPAAPLLKPEDEPDAAEEETARRRDRLR